MNWLFKSSISLWALFTGAMVAEATKLGWATAGLVFVVAVLLHVYYDVTHEEKQ